MQQGYLCEQWVQQGYLLLQRDELLLHVRSVPGLVDRPTQLICISDICQHTNTEDIAGQSAMPG